MPPTPPPELQAAWDWEAARRPKAEKIVNHYMKGLITLPELIQELITLIPEEG
jgi:hypothetical protein